MPCSIGMVFTSNATPAKLAPTGYNPATMKLLRGRSPQKSNAAPATLKFSNLSALKKSRGCGSCGGR